jgi:prepilin peptidase CpaA
MAPQLGLLPLAGFATLMVTAAVIDFRRLVIPNSIVVALCLLWPLHIDSARAAPVGAGLESAVAAVIVLAAGAFLFARGLLGGGDVKLLATASLWAGAGAVPALLILTALIGGALALVFLTPLGRMGGGMPRVDQISRDGVTFAGRTPIPYGVAIAGAALIVTIPPDLG